MTTDQQALLNAVLANPDDDAPRLIMADWFDEHGQSERAAFVRDQVAGRVPQKENHKPLVRSILGEKLLFCLTPNQEPILVSGLTSPFQWMVRSVTPNTYMDDRVAVPAKRPRAYIQRGFVRCIHVPLHHFTRFAGRFFRLHPIEQVVLTDLEPGHNYQGGASWECAGEYISAHLHTLPQFLFDLLPAEGVLNRSKRLVIYKTYGIALQAISHACCAYGKTTAGATE